MPLPEAARRHYRQRQVLARKVQQQATAVWGEVNAGDLARSWARLLPDVVSIVTPGQVAAASTADAYVESLAKSTAAGEVQAAAFAGLASDGRPLASLLYQPVFMTLRQIGAGRSLADSLEAGRSHLGLITGTQVQDAGRAADGVGIAVRDNVGYVRMLSTPSCARCAILAGRFYKWNSGFSRHPRCDCQHIPSRENVAGDLTTDTRSYFRSLGASEQERIFTKDGAQAIRDGADINKVVNARRGMTPAGTTVEGRASRSSRQGRGPRLMPERIYAEAGGDRERAVELLKEHGFVA